MKEAISNREQTELANDWRKVVNISDEYYYRRQEVTDMLVYVRRPFGNDRDRPTPHRLELRIPPYLQKTVQGKPVSSRI